MENRGNVWVFAEQEGGKLADVSLDEALFHCAKPSGVPRGPANSTASLTYQRHHGKVPQVPG